MGEWLGDLKGFGNVFSSNFEALLFEEGLSFLGLGEGIEVAEVFCFFWGEKDFGF